MPVPWGSCWAVRKRSSSPKPGPYTPDRNSEALNRIPAAQLA